MKTDRLPLPTEAELSILRVLWTHGPSTVRSVHKVLNRTKETGYTTVLKLMQIMHGKGLLARDDSERSHMYHLTATEEQTQRQLVGDLLDRAFGGSARKLVLQALAARHASPRELAEIRRLLEDMNGGAR